MELDSQRVPTRLFAYAMIAAPVLFLVSDIVTSGINDDSQSKLLTNVANDQARHYLGNLIGILGAVCLVVAVLGVALLVKSKRRRLGTIAGGVSLFGALFLPGMWLMGTNLEHMAATDRARGLLAGFLDRADDSTVLALSWVIPFGLLMLGLIALAVGLFNSRLVPRWIPVVLALGIVVTFVSEDGAASYVSSALMIAGLGGLGVEMLRASREPMATPLPPDATAPAAV